MNQRTKAHTQYYLNTGDAIHGVTTVLGILAKPALVSWANRLGLQGIDSTKFRDKAADVGTITHLLIMAHLTHKEIDLTEYAKQDIDTAQHCMVSYYEWEKAHKVKPLLVETPLSSDTYGYGGTPDCLAMINGELELLDFKTSTAIWNDYFYQLAAYRQLCIEKGYKDLNRARILRFGKDGDAGFEDRLITKFDNEFQLFLHCLSIYNLLKVMKRRL
jgi:hypothetical protein